MIEILVVEDSPSERELISRYLRGNGYQVIGVGSGQEALSKAIQKKPHVIITDVVMPEMNGFELCRSLKRNPQTRTIPIIACTSKNQELDRLWGMKQGIEVYLTKPFTQEQIVRAVELVAS
ncbi:MAG: response regulator [Chloroflexaceae bacterium]|nr:response regulator [Chloroflexaceae bacterium]